MDDQTLQRNRELFENQQEQLSTNEFATPEPLQMEQTAESVTVTEAADAAPKVVQRVRDTTERNMPQQVDELDSSVKERLQQEKNRQKEQGENAAPKQKKVSPHKVAGYNDYQEAFWNAAKTFKKTASVNTALGVKYNKYDDMDLFALRDELKADTSGKSDSFDDMYFSLDRLLRLSETNGKLKRGNKDIQNDFNEVLFSATVQVNQYVKDHSGFRFTRKGDRREQIALRIQKILKDLAKERDRLQEEMSAKNIRMAEYQAQNLTDEEIDEQEKLFNGNAAVEDMMRLVETQGFSSGEPTDAQKQANSKWIENGYTQDIKAMIEAEGVAQADKKRQNEFLAFLMDEENRKVANRVAVSVLLDSSKEATLGMPWMKRELSDYLATKLGDKTKEKTPEFVELAKVEIENFKTENKEKIDAYKVRLSRVEKELSLPLSSSNLYDYAEMQELMSEEDESVFEEKFKTLLDQVHANDRMISEILNDRYSIRTRDHIADKIIHQFGALRIFGSTDQILDQVASFCDMLKFTASREYMEEKAINEVLADYKIDKVRRDRFFLYLTENQPYKAVQMRDKEHKAMCKLYVKNMTANSKTFEKRVQEKGRLYTKEQWDALEELHLKDGEMDAEAFLAAMEELEQKEYVGEKLSRNEYLTDRKFRDEEKEPARIKHAKEERERIEQLAHTMDSKFFTHVTAEKDPMEKYRALDKAFAGKTKESKAAEKKAKELTEEREGHVKHILQKSGIPKNKWPDYMAKFARHISGISDTASILREDERLQTERENIEKYGVKNWDEALEIITLAVPQMADGSLKELDNAQAKYKDTIKKLSEYGDGKYANFAEILMEIPEVYSALMNEDEATADAFLKEVLDERLKGFMDGIDIAGTTQKVGKKGLTKVIPLAILKQYAFSYLRDIYEGNFEGDANFFASDLANYSEKVFKIKPEGAKTIGDNIKAAKKTMYSKIFFKWKKGAEAIILNAAVAERINWMTDDTEEFLKLFSLKEIEKFGLEELDRLVKGTTKNAAEEETSRAITHKIESEDDFPTTDDSVLKEREKIEKAKEQGLKDRHAFLKVDSERLEKVRLGKSLVRVQERGAKEAVDESKADAMRGRLERFCSCFDLPPILRDALVEEGSSGEDDTILKDREKLKKHALAMSKMFALFTKPHKEDPAMTDEEACMYILNLYGRPKVRVLFEKPYGPNIDKLRTKNDYKTFRKMYKELTEFEAEDSGDADLERERAEMSRDLRTMMVTNIGMLDDEGKSIQDFPHEELDKQIAYLDKMNEVTKRSREYLSRTAKVKVVIRGKLSEEMVSKNVQFSDHYLDRKAYAVLNYFMSDVIKELKDGTAFDEEAWKTKIKGVMAKTNTWDNMIFNRDSVSSEDYRKFEETKFETTDTEETIAKTLKESKNADKDKMEEYEALDEEQKKLFSLALTLMDIGSIGYGTSGTTELLNASSKKAKNLEKMQNALNSYVAGGEFTVDVNYKEAFNKLFTYKEFEVEEKKEDEGAAEGEENAEAKKKKKAEGEGEGATEGEENAEAKKKKKKEGETEGEETKVVKKEPGYVFSEVAFEKAMAFAKQITAKKKAFGEKDWSRLNDGYSSIMTAGVKYKKDKQLKEIDSVRGQYMTVDNVRDKMLEYIKKDNSFFTRNLNGLKERFEKMTPDDMKLFLRIMQDRSVLDVSQVDDGSEEELYVDHEKRNALRDALSADVDTRASVLKGFDDSESCFQVIVNALSFQIRDDINSTGKDLTEENFVEGALKRKTLADWDLIERAFDFMDEIKEKRTAVYALSHATNYINQSGNEEAIKENKEFEKTYQKKEDFKQADFESKIKEQATKDGDEDIKRVVAGYHALSDKEKNLFFKVLARRDLLDISKKNYKSNFFGKKDRDYVNQAERDKLIDKYIETSLEDNVGITLDEGAYYDAMHSLYTTQIDDTEKLTSEKDISSMMAAERNLFMLRSTAIDWKLFKRALSFVNRASEELEYAEGNAQLYRGVGNIVDNGKLDVKYTFLRKNFHRTGNQWARRIASIFERKVKEKVPVDTVLNVLVTGVSYAEVGARAIGLRKSGSLRKGLAWLKDKGTQAMEFTQGKPKEDTVKINAPDVKKVKEPTKEELEQAEQAEKERRENLNYYGHLKDGVDNFFSQAKEATDGVAETVDFVREELSGVLAEHFTSMQGLTVTKEVKQKVDKNNIVEKAITKKNEKKEEEPKDELPKFAGLKATDIVKGLQSLGEKTVYGFINNVFVNQKIDENGDEIEQLKQAADNYAGEEVEKTVKGMVGDDMAKNILDFEKKYYNVSKEITGVIKKTVNYLNYAKKCVKHVENIASSIRNIGLLKDGAKNSTDKRKEDDQKLKEAGEKRLDASQSKKAKNIVDKHRGMTNMSKELGIRLEEFNIAGDVVNFAMETASMAGGKLNVGQEAIASAIQEGLQFALFALRIASDRNVLSQYFLKTDAGKAVVDKARNGMRKSGDAEMEKKLDESIKTQEKYGSSSFIDILSDSRGYEHTSELVENTAMSMAQSIVFCASNYNPMAETRLMAITVMSVMGLDKEIGSTEPSTVEKLFNKFSMAR